MNDHLPAGLLLEVRFAAAAAVRLVTKWHYSIDPSIDGHHATVPPCHLGTLAPVINSNNKWIGEAFGDYSIGFIRSDAL